MATCASVCVAVDFVESPSEVAPFGRGKLLLVGLPFGGALPLASYNKMYYVFPVCVSLLKIEKLGIFFHPIVLTLKNVFPVLRKSKTAFLHLSHIKF